MAPKSRRIALRASLFTLVLASFIYRSCMYRKLPLIFGFEDKSNYIKFSKSNAFDSLFHSESQCRATFPGLFKEIDNSVSRGVFLLKRAQDDYTGHVQGRITDGKVKASTNSSKNKPDISSVKAIYYLRG
jgi:hypothetical protein